MVKTLQVIPYRRTASCDFNNAQPLEHLPLPDGIVLRNRTERSVWNISTICGAGGTRTHDPLLAKQMLYQLSYSPDKKTSK